MRFEYEVIVVGGGHAGVEAALAAARLGCKTVLLTQNIETIGQMSCNPAIGGIGKGHLVKEIDALDGAMAIAADIAGIHFRILNASKGPAVRATRAQADRALYKQAIRHLVENQDNLDIMQQSVDDLMIENQIVRGVVTNLGLKFYAKSVILTVGTFLDGKIHIGEKKQAGGRLGDKPSTALAYKLREIFPDVRRLKTGTPPRIDSRSIDFSVMKIQEGDTPTPIFSYMGNVEMHPRQIVCHITRTSNITHEIIRKAMHRSPLYSGEIEGIGPRYCPSIEDKVVKFPERDSHQIFVEPEGLDNNEVYPNGISTSLPFDVQLAMIRTLPGFSNAHITRPGYAIEYDFFNPTNLRKTLETRTVEGLFFAGQINGTTGYEEAAAQGLLAGINAGLTVMEKSVWEPGREEAYLGVMIDDLVTRGTREPYRMFTSRAEYRLQLREDNADLRLTPIGRKLGFVGNHRWRKFQERMNAIESENKNCEQTMIRLSKEDLSRWPSDFGPIPEETMTVKELLRRPNISLQALTESHFYQPLSSKLDVLQQIEIMTRYEGYIHRQQAEIRRRLHQEKTPIPDNTDFSVIPGLSTEIRQILFQYRPRTIGEASRIAGVTPAAVSILTIYLKKKYAQASL